MRFTQAGRSLRRPAHDLSQRLIAAGSDRCNPLRQPDRCCDRQARVPKQRPPPRAAPSRSPDPRASGGRRRIVLRPRPVERHAFARPFLQRRPIGRNRLLKPRRPALSLPERQSAAPRLFCVIAQSRGSRNLSPAAGDALRRSMASRNAEFSPNSSPRPLRALACKRRYSRAFKTSAAAAMREASQ